MARKKGAPKPPKKPKVKSVVSVVRPDVPERKKKEEKGRPAPVRKSEKPVGNIYEMLGETERTIAELSKVYAELPDSKHYGVSGRMRPTLKQEFIARQLESAKARQERLLEIIEKEGGK